ncbi:MAG: metallophosphoesterase, partial [Melioribacteraceae bacterium]|nr:metallophosphoesterase [Melioribacteraceae bacterium]
MVRKISVFVILIVFYFQLSAQPDTRFIIFGDSQFGNPAEYERMVYEASLLRPEFAIQVGDLIHGYTHNKAQLRKEWKRFKGQISLLQAPFYPVPGNHDVVTNEAEEIYIEAWGEEKLLYSFDEGAGHFIILNSWWGDEDDRIMEWQRKWLSDDLKKYSDQFTAQEIKTKSIFVFIHSPLWKYPSESEGKKDWEMVHDLLVKYPVKLVVGGHTHEHVWEEIDGINYLVINSAGVRKENIRGGKFSAFMNVVVQNDGEVEYAAIKAGSILPIDSIDPTDRIEANKFNIEEKSIRLEKWNVGDTMNSSVKVEFENKHNEEMVYRLDWFIPYKANLKITPESKFITIAPFSKITQSFTISSESTPPLSYMPSLEVSTIQKYRTGSLSRQLEEKYRNGNVGIDGYETAIKLDDKFLYSGTLKLYLPPTALVKQLNGNIIIDGNFNETAWENSDSILFSNNKSKPETITKIRFLYDNNYLYVAAVMEEPNTLGIHTSASGDIP